MPLTRAQVRTAFKRARAHFKGKIPKGTKLARFVRSRAPTSRRTRTSRHSSSPSRKRRAARRIGGAVRRTARSHPKLLTKLIHAGGLLLAFNQGVGSLIIDFQNGNAVRDPMGTSQRVLYKETGLNPNGSIDPAQATTSIVSKVGAIALVKFAGYYRRHFKM